MDSGLWWLFAVLAAVLAVAVVVTCVLVVAASRSRRRVADELAASREELAALQRRLDTLSRRVPASRPAPSDHEFVITTAGDPGVPVPAEPPAPVEHQLTARQFATVAMGESLVTVAAFGHGLRRALSAENRNRIAFEMRREVRRARMQRRRDVKEAKRHLRARTYDEDAA